MSDNEYKYNNKSQLPTRRDLRKNGTPAEALLWKSLKARQIEGVRWRRQFSIESYILDFYCPECRLGIELDGAQHYTLDGTEYDNIRSKILLQKHNIKIIRFENMDIYKAYDNVVNFIRDTVIEIKNQTPSSHNFKGGEISENADLKP